MARDQTLIFLHLPKTAGITVSKAITRQYDPQQVFHILLPNAPRGPIFSRHQGTVDQFAALPRERRASFRCILGHFQFGIHQYVPGDSVYFTVLRDPVARIRSSHRQYNKMVRAKVMDGHVELGFEEFCETHPKAIDNFMIRLLCGWTTSEHTMEENLAQSKKNLRDHFVLAGTQERFEESILLLEHLMGWQDASYLDLNVSERRPDEESVDPNLLAELHRVNVHDRNLLAFVETVMQEQIEAYEDDFKKDVIDFQNRLEARRREASRGLGFRVRRRLQSLLGL